GQNDGHYVFGGHLNSPGISQMFAADINGDHHLDLVVVAGADLFVFLGNGDGTFGFPVTHQFGAQVYTLAIGDFDQDLHPDLALVLIVNGPPLAPPTMLTLEAHGNGDGTFAVPRQIDVGGRAGVLAVADFDRDGKLDLSIGGPLGGY